MPVNDESVTTRPHLEPRQSIWSRPFASTALATLLACAVLLPLLGHKLLADWDEAIYAEISREMLTHGWLVPMWNYHPWFEKPPLMMWITAVFFKAFGVHEFWARAGSALSGVAIVGLLHGWLVRRKDAAAAWLSTAMLLGTFGFLHVCRMGETDVLLSLGCCIALCGLTAVQERRLNGWYLFWGGFAVALMAKGAASVVLVVTLLLFATLDRWGPCRFGRSWWLGLAGFLLLVLPWHLAMFHLFGRAFLDEYLGFHVLSRATRQIEGHMTHWWYYGWVLLLSAAPFVLLYPLAIVDAFRRRRLQVWAVFAVVVVGLFTLMQTRLPHYVAPAYPALSLLTAVFLSDRLRRWRTQRQMRSGAFWTRFAVVAIALWGAGAALTGGPRRSLHSEFVGGKVTHEEKESLLLLRQVFPHAATPGPLLVWREGDTRSIATALFYSQRPVQQVQLQPLPPGTATDKYIFQPKRLLDEVTAEPRVILLDKSLLARIPEGLVYIPMKSGATMEIGTIRKAI